MRVVTMLRRCPKRFAALHCSTAGFQIIDGCGNIPRRQPHLVRKQVLYGAMRSGKMRPEFAELHSRIAPPLCQGLQKTCSRRCFGGRKNRHKRGLCPRHTGRLLTAHDGAYHLPRTTMANSFPCSGTQGVDSRRLSDVAHGMRRMEVTRSTPSDTVKSNSQGCRIMWYTRSGSS